MISFIIPARNEEKYIAECLRSIINQATSEPFEIIVVDSMSTDKTKEVVFSNFPNARVIQETILGTNSARSRGYLEARGEWLIFLDADVRLPRKDWLNDLLKFVKKNNVVAVSTHYKYYEISFLQNIFQIIGTHFFIYPWVFFTNSVLKHSCHMIGGMMAIKRDDLFKVGGFDVSTTFFGDETLISKKLYKIGKIKLLRNLWVYTSGRRYKKIGMIKTIYYNLINYFAVVFFGKPFHNTQNPHDSLTE